MNYIFKRKIFISLVIILFLFNINYVYAEVNIEENLENSDLEISTEETVVGESQESSLQIDPVDEEIQLEIQVEKTLDDLTLDRIDIEYVKPLVPVNDEPIVIESSNSVDEVKLEIGDDVNIDKNQVTSSTATTSPQIIEDTLESSVSQVASSSSEDIETVKELSATSSIENLQTPPSTTHDYRTSIIRDTVFTKPTILASWAMLDIRDQDDPKLWDDSSDMGVQFLPSGKYQVDKSFTQCALIVDDSTSKIEVLAAINYPVDVAYRQDDTSRSCGTQVSKIELLEAEPTMVKNIICEEIMQQNFNLISWNMDEKENYSYSYDQVCGSDGYLTTGKANLYCADFSLAYDDPAGDYLVNIAALDGRGEFDVSESVIKYLELTNLESDFTDLQYGMVSQKKLKNLFGDLTWGNASSPTIRNIGNTRLKIKIWQNDFNLGKTGEEWNVSYKARAGDTILYVDYLPFETIELSNIYDLGEIVNLDLAILINNFPEEDDSVIFSGEMTMTAEKALQLTCDMKL